MPLEVIGAGFGRTGTHSLYLALQKLGYPTHHMVELMRDPTQDANIWTYAYDHPNSPDTDWEKVYGRYTAAVDFPTCTFYKELCERYPDAKVVLTVRTPESWYKSMQNTVFKQVKMRQQNNDRGDTAHLADVFQMMRHTGMNGLFEHNMDKVDDEAFVCDIFSKHIEDVKRNVPADRLLIMNLGDGWEPLCNFLNKPVPDEPYPRSNSSDEFAALSQGAMDAGTTAAATSA
ncbi:hypothetical protein DM01DRAFT_1331004 [Hesseltinella vesiculosa]|uniref:P-loop containing nucleoside triphosphate hydrolase protein n=1 Tax=Hesseltinella vesiculosa TaxID=101127 RepID=A0A1X2GZ01_9FUNG|nr:hypothetical protein DM01DRAFT_1331004 [Hesseltinella vesiculosa]